MGKCLDCGEEALDGEEYCEACLLLRDLGLNGNTEDHDDMFHDIEGLLPSDAPELSLDDENLASDSNPDEELLSFLDNNTEEENVGITDDDILSILDSVSPEEEYAGSHGEQEEDIMALDDVSMEDNSEMSRNSDMGDILSDALGVLNDPAMDEMEKQIMDLMPEAEQEKTSGKKEKKRAKKEKEGKEEKGWFQKLFSNVPGPEPDPDAPTEEQLEEQKRAEKEAKKKEKEEKKAAKKEVTEAKKKALEAEKAEKKALKKKLKEEEEANAPVDTGRINKAGASIILGIAACLTVFLIVGTRTFTYGNDVISAKDYFKNRQYTKAYQQIAGNKIKAKDKTTYDKILTVMKVNKEYESYENYYNMEMYPQSLDSLIKGLQRYNKYKEDAIELNIMDDMNYVKSNIVESLKDSFHLDEDAVQYLMSMDSHEKYSKEIVKLAKAS